MTRLEGGLASDVTRGLAVPHDIEELRPDLVGFHGVDRVKERTSLRGHRGAGVNLVTTRLMKSAPDAHDPDWPKYPETVLIFATHPPVEIDLRAIPSEQALSALAAAGFGKPFAIMTAFDPRGENLFAEENHRRARNLEQRLESAGYGFLPVDCCSPDRSHCECSVAVVMPQYIAIDMARELEQIAIFWFDGQRFWIVGAALETDPLMLPRRS